MQLPISFAAEATTVSTHRAVSWTAVVADRHLFSEARDARAIRIWGGVCSMKVLQAQKATRSWRIRVGAVAS